MDRYVIVDSIPGTTNKYSIYIDIMKLPFPTGTTGSYAILPARLLGLSYPDYLRFCRDELGALVIGKKMKYPVVYFPMSNELLALQKLLEKRIKYLMSEQNDPYEYTAHFDKTITRTPLEGLTDVDNGSNTDEV